VVREWLLVIRQLDQLAGIACGDSEPPAAEGIDLRVVVPARLMLQFTWTGLDQLLGVYPA
jgi:hypothetical protein